MKRFLATFAATAGVVALIGTVPVFAQRPTIATAASSRIPVRAVPQHPLTRNELKDTVPASKVTPQQKAASDQDMKTGLTQLQAASSSMQSGNVAQTMSSLKSAIDTMYQGLGIYRGHRADSILAAQDAYIALQHKDHVRQSKAIANQIAIAIRENNMALSVN